MKILPVRVVGRDVICSALVGPGDEVYAETWGHGGTPAKADIVRCSGEFALLAAGRDAALSPHSDPAAVDGAADYYDAAGTKLTAKQAADALSEAFPAAADADPVP